MSTIASQTLRDCNMEALPKVACVHTRLELMAIQESSYVPFLKDLALLTCLTYLNLAMCSRFKLVDTLSHTIRSLNLTRVPINLFDLYSAVGLCHTSWNFNYSQSCYEVDRLWMMS